MYRDIYLQISESDISVQQNKTGMPNKREVYTSSSQVALSHKNERLVDSTEKHLKQCDSFVVGEA